MKTLLAAAAMASLGISGASAADLPLKPWRTDAALLATPYNWTGFYVGVNVGGSVGRNRTTHSLAAAPGSAEQSNQSPAGIIGGGQVGYNWQFGSTWLLGIETDLQGSAQSTSYTCDASCNPLFATGQHTQKIDWLGTTRGRVGLVDGPTLSYFTAGVAYGGVTSSYVETAAGGAAASASASGTKTGWVIGSGVEASLGGNWTGKIEYLYVDLGSQTYNLTGPAFGAQSINTRIRDHIFRAGLNYNLNGNAGFVLPTANWSGAYFGGNVGSLLSRDSSNYNNTAVGAGNINETFHLMPKGYEGGAQVGYNWQAGSWVFGVEADIQGTTAKDNDACVTYCGTFFTGIADEQTLPWFGTLRGRLGYSMGPSLFYATGGLAYGETKTTITSVVPATNVNTITHTKAGYALGGGIETSFNPFGLLGKNWTAKTEYLYIDLGSSSDTYTLASGGSQFFATHTQAHVFRTGINYHFSPVVSAR